MKSESLATIVALAMTACGHIERQESENQVDPDDGWSLYSPLNDEKNGTEDFWTEVEQNLDDLDSTIPEDFSLGQFFKKTA